MSKKVVRKKSVTRRATPVWMWAAIAGAALIIVGGLALLFGSGNNSSVPDGFTPEVTGAPALRVNQTLIDEGNVKLGSTQRTVYTLKNVGDKPLKVLGEPQVQLVEGC